MPERLLGVGRLGASDALQGLALALLVVLNRDHPLKFLTVGPAGEFADEAAGTPADA